MKNLVAVLGVSHKDHWLAVRWLKWVAALANDTNRVPILVVAFTQSLSDEQSTALMKEAAPAAARVVFHRLPDSLETPYPSCASHLFLRSLEFCEREFPDCPVLWCEPDTVAMRPGWFQAIETEYASCGKPFMGHVERRHGPAHLTGVAVYPPDWRTKAERLATVLQAPDNPMFGPKSGQAFDVWAACQTVPQAHHCQTIQLIWRPKPFGPHNLRLIHPGTALFHQCKDGRLTTLLSHRRFGRSVV